MHQELFEKLKGSRVSFVVSFISTHYPEIKEIDILTKKSVLFVTFDKFQATITQIKGPKTSFMRHLVLNVQ